MSDAAVPAWIEAIVAVVGMIGSSVITLVAWSFRMADRLRLRDEHAGKALNAATDSMRDRLDAALGAVTTQIQGIAKESRDDREKLANRVGEVEKLVAEIRGAINGLSSTVKRAIGP